MHQLEVSVSRLHTNTQLNRINFNCNWTSINLRECQIANNIWLPHGSPFKARINLVENLPTVVVIPIPARSAEIANLFVTLQPPVGTWPLRFQTRRRTKVW